MKRSPKIAAFVILSLSLIVFGKVFLDTGGQARFLYLYGIAVTSTILLVFTITYFFYKDPYEEVDSDDKDSDLPVSVLVAVYNEEAAIEECLDSLVAQNYQNKEVIVVNDASTDGTNVILDDYAKEADIKIMHLDENVGKKRALAAGMLEAKGEIFAFTDSDSVWAPDVLNKVVPIFASDPEVGGVSGHCRALNGGKNLITKVQDSWYEGQFSVMKAFESVFGSVSCVSGPLAVFRKEAIFNFIPAWANDSFLGQEFLFATDRTLTGFVLGNKAKGKELKEQYQDSDFIKRADYPLKEWKVVYSKAARSWTIVPDTVKKMFHQQVRWKKSFIRNTFFTGSFFWQKPIIVSLLYYLHIIFVIIGPFIVFRHLIYLPMHGNLYTALLYIGGILFIGFLFGLGYKIEVEGDGRWTYRPLMSLLSTLVLSWLIFYSALTIKNMTWVRG